MPPPPPILGLTGGIASGKSFYARLLERLGCLVIDADRSVATIYQDPAVLAELARWWGPSVLHPDGSLDRKAVAAIVFADPDQRHRLERLVHPRVEALRHQQMAAALAGPSTTWPRAFVWDFPLLIEIGLHAQCAGVLFVDTPDDVRIQRARARGWDEAELRRREAAQTPLAEKRRLATHLLDGTAPEPAARAHLTRLLTDLAPTPEQILPTPPLTPTS